VGFAHFDAGAGGLLELFSGDAQSSQPKRPPSQSVMVALRVDDLRQAEETLKQRGVRFTDKQGYVREHVVGNAVS